MQRDKSNPPPKIGPALYLPYNSFSGSLQLNFSFLVKENKKDFPFPFIKVLSLLKGISAYAPISYFVQVLTKTIV